MEADGSYFGKRLADKCEKFGAVGETYQTLWVTTPDRADKIDKAIAIYANQSVLVLD